MNVIIGVDPHKATHTAVALDGNEGDLGEIQVGANASQLKRLLAWAAPFQERTWAIEGAGGCGYLLSQQLVAAGEDVVDVPATLAARVRVLGSGKSNKNDPNDARSVAIAALRAPRLARVRPSDHASVLRLLAKRNSQLSSSRTRTACRLHALLAELVAGGSANKLKANDAERILAEFKATTPVQAARHALAVEHLEDMRRVDAQITESKRRIAEAVAASGTSVTDIVGVGPIVAAMVIGYTGDVRRFGTRHRYAAYTGTAPIEMSSGGRVIHRLSRRGNRQLNHAMHIAALSQIRYPDTDGRVYYDRKIAEGKTSKEAFRALKRRISDAVYRQLLSDTNLR
ncbi:MAG: IS110 family transposase [Actinobacteria bacterium]|nr:IS110 family transposase [Actinomycetota bacterium]